MRKFKNTLILALLVTYVSSCETIRLEGHPLEITNVRSNTQWVKFSISDTLDDISIYLYSKTLRNDYNTHYYLFIYYYLPNMDVTGTPYAIASWNPKLNVSLLGTENSDGWNLSEVNVQEEGKLIGKWQNIEDPAHFSLAIYKLKQKYILIREDKEGITLERELIYSEKDGKGQYSFDYGHHHGQSYEINNNGELEIYNRKGKHLVTVKSIE